MTVRDLIERDEETSVELVARALRRLADSPSSAHADYGARQLELLAREPA